MEASITFKAVGKTVGKKTLLADLSFGVEKGSNFVLVGENGSGKSIFLNLLVGLIEKDTGSIYIHGKDINTRSLETRSLCGFMPQTVNLDEDLNVFNNISIHGQLHGFSASEAKKKTLYWADLLGFAPFLNQSVTIYRQDSFDCGMKTGAGGGGAEAGGGGQAPGHRALEE